MIPIFEEQRRDRRKRVIFSGEIRLSGRQGACLVADISAAGARVESQLPLCPGDVVGLTVGAHPEFPAAVIWKGTYSAGLAFIDGAAGGLRRWGSRADKLGLR